LRDLLGGRERVGAARVMQICADRDVLGDRQPGEGLRDLEGACDAAAGKQVRRKAGDIGAFEEDVAGWRQETR
jgi:hypothetical protein